MVKDILLDDNYECVMAGRDVAVGDCGEQLVVLLANTMQGEWKRNPLSGWNMAMRKNQPKSELKKLVPQIMEDMSVNGYEVKVRVNDNELNIEL